MSRKPSHIGTLKYSTQVANPAYEAPATKPPPAPHVPGNTEWERFDDVVGMLLTAPKQAFAKQEEKLKR